MKKRSPGSKAKSRTGGRLVVALLLVLVIGATIGAAVIVGPRRAQTASPSTHKVLGQQSSLTDQTDVDASLEEEVSGVNSSTVGTQSDGAQDEMPVVRPTRDPTLQVAKVGFHSATVSVTPSELEGTWTINNTLVEGTSSKVIFTGLEPGTSYTVTWTGATDRNTLETSFVTRESVVEVSENKIGFHEATINVLVDTLESLSIIDESDSSTTLTPSTEVEVEGLVPGTTYTITATDAEDVQRLAFKTRKSVVQVDDIGFEQAEVKFLGGTSVTWNLYLEEDLSIGDLTNGGVVTALYANQTSDGMMDNLQEGRRYVLMASDNSEYVQTVPFETRTRRAPTLTKNSGVVYRTHETMRVLVEVNDPDGTQPTVEVKVGLNTAEQDPHDDTVYEAKHLEADQTYTVTVWLDNDEMYTTDEKTCSLEVGGCDPASGMAEVSSVCDGDRKILDYVPCAVDCVFKYEYVDERRPYGGNTPMCYNGKHVKRRNIIHTAKNGGQACPTETSVQEACFRDVDCSYSEWEPWGRCVAGIKTRERSIASVKEGRGKACDLERLSEIEPCVLSADFRPGEGDPDQQYNKVISTAGTTDWLNDAFGSILEAKNECSTRVECTGITQKEDVDGDIFYLNGPRARTREAIDSSFLHKLDVHPLGHARYTMALDGAPCAADNQGVVRCSKNTDAGFGFTLAPLAGYTGVYTLRDDQGRVCSEDRTTSYLRCASMDGEPQSTDALAIQDAREMRGGVNGLPCALINEKVLCKVGLGDKFAFTPAPGSTSTIAVEIGASLGPRVVPYPLGVGALTSLRGRKRFMLSRSGDVGSEQWHNINGPGETFFEVHLDDARRRITCWKLDKDNMLRTDEGWDVVLFAQLIQTPTDGDTASQISGGDVQRNYTRHEGFVIASGEQLNRNTVLESEARDECDGCGDCAGYSIDGEQATLYRTIDQLSSGEGTVHVRTTPTAGGACAFEPAPWSSALFVQTLLRDESSSVRVPRFAAMSTFHRWANRGKDLADAFVVHRGKEPIVETLLVAERNLYKQTGFVDAINDTRCAAMWRTGSSPASDVIRLTRLLSEVSGTRPKSDSAVWFKKVRTTPFLVQPGVYTLRPVWRNGYLGAKKDGRAFVDGATVAYRADSWPLHLLFELHQPGDSESSGWAMRNLYTKKYASKDNKSRELSFDINSSTMFTSPLEMNGYDNLVQLVLNNERFGTQGTSVNVEQLTAGEEQWFELALRSDTVPIDPADADPSPNYITTRDIRADHQNVLSKLDHGQTLDEAFAQCSELSQCAAVSENTNSGELRLLKSYHGLQTSDGIHLHQNKYYEAFDALAAETQPETAPERTQAIDTVADVYTDPEATTCEYEERLAMDFSVGDGLWDEVGTIDDCKSACDQKDNCAGFSRKKGEGQRCWFKKEGTWRGANSDVVGYKKSNTPCGLASYEQPTAPRQPPETQPQATPGTVYTKHENQRQDPNDPQHLDPMDPTGQVANIRSYDAAKAKCDAEPDCAGFHLNKNKRLYQFKTAIDKLTTGRNFTTWTKQA